MYKILALLTCLFTASSYAAFPDAKSLETCGEREGGFYVVGKYQKSDRLVMKIMAELPGAGVAAGLASAGLSDNTKEILMKSLPATVKPGSTLDFINNGTETFLKVDGSGQISMQDKEAYQKIYTSVTGKLKAGGWKTDLTACN